MAIPRGESGARTDTAAGRAAEAAFQQRKAAAAAQAAMRVAQAEAEAGRAAAAAQAIAAAQAAAARAAPAVQQAVQSHAAQIVAAVPAAAPAAPATPTPPSPTNRPAAQPDDSSSIPEGGLVGLRPNPITGEMVISGGSSKTQQEVIDRFAKQGVRAVVSGSGSQSGSSGSSAEAEYWKNRAAQDAADAASSKVERDQTAVAFVTDILRQYGMAGLGSSIESLVQQWGNNTAVIAEKIRQTDPYKARFKGMLALQAKGVTDIRNEAEYINLETDYRSVFRDNGLASFLGTAGTQGEFDKIASIVGDYSVSVNEVKSRIQDAQRVAAETPQEVKDALQRYYNVPASMLVEYTLDKARTTEQINTIANNAVIGGYASRAGLNVDLTAAGQVSALSQGQDIGIDKLQTDLAGVRDVRDSTARLARIEDSTLSDSETLLSEMNVDTTARKKVKDLQSRERARFAGTSGIETGSLSRNSGF